MRVALVHPDLGLGGAERLVIDLALALKQLDHDPVIYTAHRDPSRCFSEVHPASERVPVRVINTLFPRKIFRRFHALLAALRCVVLALYVCVLDRADVAIVDIVSLPVLVFALFRLPVIFYCHFPDQKLEQSLRTQRSSVMRRAYRMWIDRMEQFALSKASVVVCNSEFTQKVYKNTFPSLPVPRVVYPCVHLIAQAESAVTGECGTAADGRSQAVPALSRPQRIVSLNRYERKKNIPLAIDAFGLALRQLTEGERTGLRLVVAGGFDARLQENVEHYCEMERSIVDQGLQKYVELRRNISDGERRALIDGATVLVYTPRDEHFGIVPLEAMALGTAVLAANSGGPMETVVDGVTGYLRPPTPQAFSEVLVQLIRNPGEARYMGKRGRDHVARKFSLEALTASMNPILEQFSSRSYQDLHSGGRH